jgi:hypothetical protein
MLVSLRDGKYGHLRSDRTMTASVSLVGHPSPGSVRLSLLENQAAGEPCRVA